MKKVVFAIFFLILLNSVFLFSQNSKKDTLTKNHPITKDLLLLPSVSNFFYMLPPEKSFTRDTNKVFLGFSSSKYPDSKFTIILSGTGYEDDEELLKKRYNILQQGTMRVNESFDLWYYKLSSKATPDLITWTVFFKNEFFYGNAKFSYLSSDDKILGKGMEKLINSFVVIQRPDIHPSRNVFVTTNFDAITLKFVKKVSWAISYFTEDGFPITETKGNKVVAFMTAPRVDFDPNEESVSAIIETNKIFSLNDIKDSIVVEKVEPTTIMEFDGVKLSGSLASNSEISFFSYYAKVTNRQLFLLIFGMGESEDKEDIDKMLNNFRETMLKNYDEE